MPRFGYSAKAEEPCAKALGREMRISPKQAVEVCRAIRGMGLEDAKKYLEAVVEKRVPVPFKRHRKKIGHRRGIKGWDSGRFPTKVAKAVLEVLKNAEANAVYKGLDVDKLKIVHASAQKGIKIPGFIPRAFGRATPFDQFTTNLEIILKEAA